MRTECVYSLIVVPLDQNKTKESNSFMVTQLSSHSDIVGIESLVAEDVEVRTEVNDNVSCSNEMANTKQTKRKQNTGQQGSPARFPSKGKPKGKAARHLPK